MASIYERLNFNFDDPENKIVELSTGAQNYLNSFPTLLSNWQIDDIANQNVNNYFENPVATSVDYIRSNANNINIITDGLNGTTSEITDLFVYINTTLSNIANSESSLFLEHTNRISGVTNLTTSIESSANGINGLLPHYDTAVAYGRVVMHIVYQTDSVKNNSPVMGSFTSILVGNTLASFASNLSNHYTTINNSISTGTSNLTLAQVETISTEANTVKTLLVTRREHDVNYFSNVRSVISDYGQVTQFSNMGEVQTDLVTNYIGSAKLLSRIT